MRKDLWHRASPLQRTSEASSPHYARTTCRDRGSGRPFLRAGGSGRRNSVGALSRDGVGYGRGSIRQRRIVAALIVSSEARPCSEGVYKVREAFLSGKEGSGSGCALPHKHSCRRLRVLSSRRPGVLGSRTLRRTGKYASGPSPCGCPVARPSPRSRNGVSCMMRASRQRPHLHLAGCRVEAPILSWRR
jgi:hypothetical protein